MKINGKYILRQVAGENLLVPVGEAALRMNGIITLNEAAVVIWQGLEAEDSREEILSALTTDFDVDEETAASDLDDFLALLSAHNMITDEA